MEKRFAWSFFHSTWDKNNVLLAEKKNPNKPKKKDHCFPTKVSLLVVKRDGDLVLEWQRVDVRKRAWGWEKGKKTLYNKKIYR